jgi:putative membrane protein
MKLLFKLILNVFTLLIVAYIIPGFEFDGLWATVVAAVVMGAVNTFIRPILPSNTFYSSYHSHFGSDCVFN